VGHLPIKRRHQAAKTLFTNGGIDLVLFQVL
jgi:hypothetical protein